MSYYMLNKNLNELLHEDAKTTINFILGLLMGDHRSSEANNSPDPGIIPGESEVLDIPAYGYFSDFSSSLGESYNNIRTIFLF